MSNLDGIEPTEESWPTSEEKFKEYVEKIMWPFSNYDGFKMPEYSEYITDLHYEEYLYDDVKNPCYNTFCYPLHIIYYAEAMYLQEEFNIERTKCYYELCQFLWEIIIANSHFQNNLIMTEVFDNVGRNYYETSSQ